MPSLRQIKMNKEVAKIVGEFIASLSNRTSLITITRADLSPDFRHGTIWVTVLPEELEDKAILFLERNRTEMRDHLRKKLAMRRVPFLSIKLDKLEKKRHSLYTLLSAENNNDHPLISE